MHFSPRLGVCSWSLTPDSIDELVARLTVVGATGVQLALEPIRTAPARWANSRERLAEHGIDLLSGMFQSAGEDYTTPATIRATGGVVPDDTWDETWARVEAVAPIAAELGIDTVSFHAGFIPEDGHHDVVVERVREIADHFSAVNGATVLLETGQENAATLGRFLSVLDRADVGVNFDPANMLLYDMGDPIRALERLLPSVRQVHLKDAHPPAEAGVWGEEVVVGTGDVDWRAFLSILAGADFAGALVVEREAGSTRVEDIRAANAFITDTLGALV